MLEPCDSGLTISGNPSGAATRQLCRWHVHVDHRKGRRRHVALDEPPLGGRFAHGQPACAWPAAGVGHAQRFELLLHAAILPCPAVQRDEAHVDRAAVHVRQRAFGRIDSADAVPGGCQPSGNGCAAAQADFALRRIAARQHDDVERVRVERARLMAFEHGILLDLVRVLARCHEPAGRRVVAAHQISISVSSSMPSRSSTRSRTRSISLSTSAVVAPGSATMKLACRSLTSA